MFALHFNQLKPLFSKWRLAFAGFALVYAIILLVNLTRYPIQWDEVVHLNAGNFLYWGNYDKFVLTRVLSAAIRRHNFSLLQNPRCKPLCSPISTSFVLDSFAVACLRISPQHVRRENGVALSCFAGCDAGLLLALPIGSIWNRHRSSLWQPPCSSFTAG